ncbi:hypothetical protein MA16_Dca027567 [Dendrobium catenatum]|uniref:Uncharacterized protein n=1 Tax=Dendrobium catenatum TaxID=906689 RepID=A0A2I0WXJ4_9ASPA|nr:hypothetical protein MA16_Dca019874 [Dendrobium catenatum]PKU86414.1 hypothetical protein MA16_Dca027567 [Dendrobium catenatum]
MIVLSIWNWMDLNYDTQNGRSIANNKDVPSGRGLPCVSNQANKGTVSIRYVYS